MSLLLPATCEQALLERFLKAEAMALWAIRAAQETNVSLGVLQFLRRHEEEEVQHLKQFEVLLGTPSFRKSILPRAPTQWCILAVHLYGYETLGLEFAKLLIGLRPDLVSIMNDEETHVKFFEDEVSKILFHGGPAAKSARQAAHAWRRRLPPTLGRYLADDTLTPYRALLQEHILAGLDLRFHGVGLRLHVE